MWLGMQLIQKHASQTQQLGWCILMLQSNA
jgi:hypothetical protein